MPAITLPHNFKPRPYQLPVLRALDNGAKRAVVVWHRRAGKEKTFINYVAKRSAQRVGSYYYFFPTFTQAKRAIWDGRDRDGFPFLGHFPKEYVVNSQENELKKTLASGSIFQLIGTDNFDSIMSTNPIGCVFAEYALQDPRAWDYIRPILRENGGWAIFDFTPRGKNHGYEIYELARKRVAEGDKDWYCERLTVDDTGQQELVLAERRDGMSEEMIEQEYYCSFEGVQQGAIFGREMEVAEREKRICGVPWQPEIAVDTWWDWGMNDPMAIWMTQTSGREVHVIDCHQSLGGGLPACAKHLQTLPYVWGTHKARIQDINFREAGSGKSRLEIAKSLNLNFEPVPEIGLQEGIEAARLFVQRCWFDSEKTAEGRRALVSYHREYDDKAKVFKTSPKHDWSSNYSDAFRYLAVGHKMAQPKRRQAPVYTVSSEGSSAWLGA